MNQHQNFDDSAFWEFLRRVGRKLPFIRQAIAMYAALRDPNTPLWVKAAIAGALIYLMSPIDAIPDYMPIIGWTDDAGVIAGAAGSVAAYITSSHWKRADEILGII